MPPLIHPHRDDLELATVLAALGDPYRLAIVRKLAETEGCMACNEAAPCPDMAKSTLSHHFRILREAGVIRTEKRGVEHRNVLRQDDLEARFPGLVEAVLKLMAN